MNQRIIVRAVWHPDRIPMIEYLQERLPGAEWCWDEQGDAMDTFIRAMRMAGDDPAVHMEEDVLLAADFLPRLNAAIAQRPDRVIQFFSMRRDDAALGSRWDAGSRFSMNQCFYLPAGYATQIADFMPRWERRAQHPTGYDLMIADWLKARRERYWLHVPSLVQHRVARSLIDSRRSSRRQSATFPGE